MFHIEIEKIVLITLLLLAYNQAPARSIFVNGIDISSARHQEINNVTIRIDGEGNIFIIAPHYQVNEESTYIPLSSWKNKMNSPKRKGDEAQPNISRELPSHPAMQQKSTRKMPPMEQPKQGSKTQQPVEQKNEN